MVLNDTPQHMALLKCKLMIFTSLSKLLILSIIKTNKIIKQNTSIMNKIFYDPAMMKTLSNLWQYLAKFGLEWKMF